MACLIKPPQGSAKGVVVFTTPERDQLIRAYPDIASAAAALKSRYLLGLHHNWHDTDFRHDPLFDFNMAGEEDLVSRTGGFPLLPMDACNFSPPVFVPGGDKFWDVLFVARAVKFKGIPEFFRTVRTLYDSGRMLRVLLICPLPPPGPGTEGGLRALHASLFTPQERHYFSLLTVDWDYPFPFDLPALAHFYRSSRIFVHSAPDERRCRVAAYAWASGLPVVGKSCVGSILPAALRTSPYFFECADHGAFPSAILNALEVAVAGPDFMPVRRLVSGEEVVLDMERRLGAMAATGGGSLSALPTNSNALDLRLGRHHGLSMGTNRVEQDLGTFIHELSRLSDAEIAAIASEQDPEVSLAVRAPCAPRQVGTPSPAGHPLLHRLRRLVGA